MLKFVVFFVVVLLGISCQQLPPEAKFIEENKISGVIKIDSKIENKCKGFLFIIVRNMDSNQPLAVKRIKNPSYPYSFTVSPADVMIESNLSFFKGDLILYVKTSKSGNPFEEGGYCDSEAKTLKSGTSKVEIILNNYIE